MTDEISFLLLSEPPLFDQLQVCDTKEIAAKVFASTPTFVIQQKDLGHFPQPSWRTPGNRGKLVWLVRTVERWMLEYTDRAPADGEDRAAANDAATEATRIAEQYDAELKEKLFNRNARSAPGRESESERNQIEMVATA